MNRESFAAELRRAAIVEDGREFGGRNGGKLRFIVTGGRGALWAEEGGAVGPWDDD